MQLPHCSRLQRMMERFLNQAANDHLVEEPADVALALRNLTAGYNGRIAIAGLTGDFPKGSATAVIGPHGAGKSTLLKVMAGQVRAMAGNLICKNARIAFLPQQAEVDRSFPINVRDMVGFGLLHRTGPIVGPNRKMRPKIEEALQAVGLEGFGDRTIGALSGGQFQRTLFARCCCRTPTSSCSTSPFPGSTRPRSMCCLPFCRAGAPKAGRSSPRSTTWPRSARRLPQPCSQATSAGVSRGTLRRWSLAGNGT